MKSKLFLVNILLMRRFGFVSWNCEFEMLKTEPSCVSLEEGCVLR